MNEIVLNMNDYPALYQVMPEVTLISEDDFIQAGIRLVEIGRLCKRALGELLAIYMESRRIETQQGVTEMIRHYSGVWGIPYSTLMQTYVVATKFPEVERPQDLNITIQYEVLAGSSSKEEADEAFNEVAVQGLGVQQVRELKQLRSTVPGMGWRLVELFEFEGKIWVRDPDTKACVIIARVEPDDGDGLDLWQAGVKLLKLRARL